MPLKYEVVTRDIESKIRSGAYKPNQQLPVAEELCRIYGVSRITIRRALDLLVEKGLVVKRRGAGTFVKDTDALDTTEDDISISGYANYARTHGVSAETEVKVFEVVEAEGRVAERLRVQAGTFVYHIVRVRHVHGTRGLVSYTWIPITILPDLTEKDVCDSLYQTVAKVTGLTVASAHRSIRAVMPDDFEREALNLPPEVPLLEIDQVVYLRDGQLFEYSVLHRDTRDYSFEVVQTS